MTEIVDSHLRMRMANILTPKSVGKYDLYVILKPYFESVESINIKDQKKKISLKQPRLLQPSYILDITVSEKKSFTR